MVSDNQLDQYFQFVKDMLLEEVCSWTTHRSILRTVSIKTCLPFRVWTKEYRQHDNYSIHCWFVLYETSQMSLTTCSLLRQSRPHICNHHRKCIKMKQHVFIWSSCSWASLFLFILSVKRVVMEINATCWKIIFQSLKGSRNFTTDGNSLYSLIKMLTYVTLLTFMQFISSSRCAPVFSVSEINNYKINKLPKKWTV